MGKAAPAQSLPTDKQWSVQRFGRIRMQLLGFAGMVAGMALLFASAALPGAAGSHLVIVVIGFGIFNLFMNMGPNSTTCILPAELFPTQLRATGAGFAAACAKIGATIGVFIIPLIKTAFGLPAVLAFMAIISALGLASTWAFSIERHGLTLEQRQSATLP
jgi:predicted MFS family arabinose efflux permease